MENTTPENESMCNYRTLLIHGTFSSPKAEGERWHKSGSSFSVSLKQKLAGTHLEGSVRPSNDPNGEGFSWSGSNDHFERLEAAKNLCEKIREDSLNEKSVVFNFIAHSHGGNVLLKAIELIYDEISASCFTLCQSIKPDARNHISGDDLDKAIINAFGNLNAEKIRIVRDEFLGAPTITFGGVLKNRGGSNRPKTTVNNYHIQRKLFENQKFHGIGSCVFVGVPFYHVRERMPYSHPAFKVLTVLLGLIGIALIGAPISDEWFESRWSALLLFPLLLWAGVVLIGSMRLGFARSGYNLYFYEGSEDIRRQINDINKGSKGTIPALTINSSRYDEVFIALKNRDRLWGLAQAQVGNLVDPSFPLHRRLTDNTFVGRRIRLAFSPWIQVAEALFLTVRVIIVPATLAVSHLAKNRFKRALGERILGLEGVYMSRFVEVVVSSQIGEDTIFKEDSEDVLDSDIESTLSDAMKNFDTQGVNNERAESIIRNMLPPGVNNVERGNFVPLEQKLKCLIRFLDKVGSAVELSHSRYFGSDRILSRIADFLKSNSEVHQGTC